MSLGRMDEFVSKGSKLDDAHKAALTLKQYERAVESLRAQSEDLSKLKPDELINTVDPEIVAQQAALKADPRFVDAKQNVLKNNLSAFDDAVEDAAAKRVVLEQATENFEKDVAH